MAWKLTVGGVDKTTSIDQKSGVSIKLQRNERGTASFRTVPGYFPALFAEVVIYDTDGVTPIFGGIVYNRKIIGVGLLNFMDIECVDWSVYASLRTASHTFTGNITLKAFLQFIVNNYLVDYGITLAAGQVTGPTVDATNYTWTYKRLDEALRDATTYSGGYTYSITPGKVLEMVLVSAAPAAPFTITDANSNVIEIDWSESAAEYATKVILLCGGTGTKELTQTWTVTLADLSAGYLETDVPSIPTGGVSITVNGSPKSIGASGTEIIWNWVTHRITAGSFVASVGDVIVLTYTAQYPFAVVADSGVTPPLEVVIDMQDVTSKSVATPMAAGLLARYYQVPKHFEIETIKPGFRPGQQVTINLSGRSTGSVVALITDVEIELISDGFWRYRMQAFTGVFTESPLDYFRSLGGIPPTASFSTGVNPATILNVLQVPLGGSQNAAQSPASGVWANVVNAAYWVAKYSMTAAIVRCTLSAKNSGVTVQARLYDETAGSSVGTSSTVSSTTPTPVTITANIIAGHSYKLQISNNANNEGIYCYGTIESP